MNCDFTLKKTPAELFLLHFRSRAHPFIPNLPHWLNGAIITAMESSPQQGLRGHSAELRLIYWPLTGVWSKQYQSTSMNHVCWKPPLLTMPCNFRVIYSRWLFGARAMPPNASRGAWWDASQTEYEMQYSEMYCEVGWNAPIRVHFIPGLSLCS